MTRTDWVRASGIASTIVTISVAHYATDPARIVLHVAYQDLCYVPILVAAYWFGAPGGIAAALLAGFDTIAHFHEGWHGNIPFIYSQYGQAVGFVITGAVGGVLASAERRATRRHQQAIVSLEAANAELRASHEQLLRADRLSRLGEIAAGLAHEIRNPLAGVKGALEIVVSRAAGGSPEAEFGAIASKEIQRLDELISEFLAYARPHEPRRQEVDIFDVLDRVVSLISHEAGRHDVVIEAKRTPVPRMWVDPEQIEQVFFNIVLNAAQVTPSGGRVDIRASATPEALVVDVCDEGPGIPPEHLSRVFDPFFSTKKMGTGLGLAISQRIVQGHRGTISIIQPGRGTIVRTELPLGAAGMKPDLGRQA